MSNSKFLMLLLISISLQSLIKTQAPEELNKFNHSLSFTLNGDKNYVINYSEKDLINMFYLTISTYGLTYDTPGFIYVSFTENPSVENRTYLSQSLGKNEIIIHKNQLINHTKLYINIHSLNEAQIQFDSSSTISIDLSIYDARKKLKISDAQNLISLKLTEDLLSKKIMIYGIGESVDYFSMKVCYIEGSNVEDYIAEQKFDNGYAVIIDLNGKSTSGVFDIQLIPNSHYPGIDSDEKEVEVGMELTENNAEVTQIIDIMEHIYGYILTSKNCYSIPSLDKKREITILLNVYTQALTFGLYKGEEEYYNMNVFHNYYLKLTPELLTNASHFCLRKFTPQEKETTEYGEISYDFQIYYTDELSKVQSYLFPLVNGKIYTNSLKKDEIMIYRHLAFSKFNFLYSSIMTSIRGNPVLYGYPCDTFPDCNLDINKFNELKKEGKLEIINKINNYYINKKDYAQGDQEKDGQKMSEARQQYLSVVVCESTDDMPNKGECQYNIEIDNHGDEIQLIPELTHVNSFMIFSQNSFRIRIEDYLNTKSLKIYFTILTGNADINIFGDKNRTRIVTSSFTYRHVHRKEIFEKNYDIAKNYYLDVTTEGLAFIEIKYETDFHYKGYKRLNPNEINIEFFNKGSAFTPYEISNPHYFYPITNPKNNDFYFTIIPLDCGVVYKYNFNEEYNITYKHHYVKKEDINFGTSYGFELKIDNYFHTPSDNKEDCAMIIYTGEKSQDYPLLILEDMFHPTTLDETHYVYPFTINNELQGIIIQIKFDVDSIINLNMNPLVVITFKITNQQDDYDIHTITKDSSFFIGTDKIKQYCPEDFYQCSLIIEIIKLNADEENPFTILTNVHSSYESVEYVSKDKVHTYSLRPLDMRYFYTQIDKDEKGEINFMFNKGNAKVYARMVEKDNYELYYNWNKRVRLPEPTCEDLLYYDYLNNIIKYDAKDLNGCNEGCELYFLIESEETTKEPSYLTEVSFSIDKKWKEDENGIIEMSLDKYVKGVVDGSNYKYFTITINDDYKKISFNLYTSYTTAYIKLGKTHFCKKEDKQWEITQKEGFGRIIINADDELIKKDTLKGVSFSIGIKKRDDIVLLGNENLFYYFEVQGLYNNPKSYYQLNSERSVICNTETDNYCHVMLYINRKYINDNILLYALPLNNENITIYSKYYSSPEIENKTYFDSIQDMFPNKENNYDQKSEGNYLFINHDNINENFSAYILLSLYANKENNLIKIITSGVNAARTLLPYNTEKLIYFTEKIKFYLPYDYKEKNGTKYITNIRTVKGTQKLLINSTEVFPELNGNYYVEMESYPYSQSFIIDYIMNEQDKEQGLFITFEKTKNDKLFGIEKEMNNEVALDGNKSFPQYIYILLEYQSSMKIECSFYDMTYDKQSGDDAFKISGIIINKDILNKRKINPGIKIDGEVIDGSYSLEENKGIIFVNKNKIKNDDQYYLLITIDKDSGNNNDYNSIKVKYTPSIPEDEPEEEEQQQHEEKESEKYNEEEKEKDKKEEEKECEKENEKQGVEEKESEKYNEEEKECENEGENHEGENEGEKHEEENEGENHEGENEGGKGGEKHEEENEGENHEGENEGGKGGEKHEEEKEFEKKEEEKEVKKKEIKTVDTDNVALIISLYIVGICLAVPLIVFICIKLKRRRSRFTINNNDINENLGINDDSLLPQN